MKKETINNWNCY